MEDLKKLLKDTPGALVSMEEHISRITDKFVVTSVNHFEEVRKWMSLHCPQLDLNSMDPFKVILNEELMDEEWLFSFLVINLITPSRGLCNYYGMTTFPCGILYINYFCCYVSLP